MGDIHTALHARIEKLPWMSDPTKAKALEKLSKFTVKIGYPDKWRDYSKLVLKPDDLYGNVQRSGAFEWRRDVARLNGPVDKSEWGMTPQTVNAYYNSTEQRDRLPGRDPGPAVLRSGRRHGDQLWRHRRGDRPRDQPRLRRPGPQVRTATACLPTGGRAEDAAKFKAQTDRLGAQYSAFEPLPGAHVQGGLMMGENIGDLGGLSPGARRLPRLAARQARAGDRRPDRRSAGVPGLGPGVA